MQVRRGRREAPGLPLAAEPPALLGGLRERLGELP
jgi:hypothetical protein